MIEIPYFENKDDLFNFLFENKSRIIAQKKSTIKHSDGISFNNVFYNEKEKAFKANEPVSIDLAELEVRAVINTTNYMDSHMDVHIPGLWKKSLSENKMIMHVQEHKSNLFSHIISDGADLKAFTKLYKWKDLYYDEIGETEALVFDSVVKKDRNDFMFKQYAKGYVKNHSVGMQYVKIVMAVNSDSGRSPEMWGAEMEAWDKYFQYIINSDKAIDNGFFFAVTEAKIIEGSAVPMGSNPITPTMSIKTFEPLQSTQTIIEPSKDTQAINYQYLIENFKL